MNANELKIGNFVISKTFKEVVTINLLDKWQDYDNIEPIELNKEWLEKLGFTCNWTKVYCMKLNNGMELSYNKYGKFLEINIYIEYEDTSFDLTWVKYVHQLQNLYFALTNEELTQK